MVGQCSSGLEAAGSEITWEDFKIKFLEKLFPDDIHGKKEIEFLQLKQGNMMVFNYATKRTSLCCRKSKYHDRECTKRVCQVGLYLKYSKAYCSSFLQSVVSYA